MIRALLLAVVVGAVASGCTTNSVEMTYDQAAIQPVSDQASQSVALGAFSDRRGHGANWLGAIRGGFGNPLKTLETPQPVNEVVRDAYRQGLEARGILAAGDSQAPIMRVVINQFDCNQYVRREAHIEFAVELWDPEAERVVYEREVVVDNVEGSLVSLDTGVFAEVEDLRKVANDTLQQAVDKTLDDPAMRAALGGQGAGTS